MERSSKVISKEELENRLKNSVFLEEQINIILNKNIIKKRTSKKIEEILKLLEEYEISKETIENYLLVLAYGQAKEKE